MKAFRRGWCYGSNPVRKGMLQLMEGKLGDHHCGEQRRESAQGKAERIMAEEHPAAAVRLLNPEFVRIDLVEALDMLGL